MKRFKLPALVLLLVTLGGCAEYKEYHYKEFSISREDAYSAMMDILAKEGYDVVEIEENYVNDLPEVYLESDWNMRQTGGTYKGNDVRRKAYVKITTVYSEREVFEYQPLNEEDAEAMKERDEELAKKAELEQTRIGVAVRTERKSDITQPLESDWQYDGPDSYEVTLILGRFEAAYGEKKNEGGGKASAKGTALKKEELESRHRR